MKDALKPEHLPLSPCERGASERSDTSGICMGWWGGSRQSRCPILRIPVQPTIANDLGQHLCGYRHGGDRRGFGSENSVTKARDDRAGLGCSLHFIG